MRKRTSEELLRDPQVRSASSIVHSNFSFESFYLHGSWASGRQRPSSDFDIILLMSLPSLMAQTRRLGQLYGLKKRHRIDLKIISTGALGRNGGSIRIKNWQKTAVLISGRSLLQNQSPITAESYTINAFNIGVQLLRALSVTAAGVQVNEHRLRSIAHYLEEDAQNLGIPERWKLLSKLVANQRKQIRPDGRLLCSEFADYLSEIRSGLNFSPLDQWLYVVMSMLEKKRLRVRTFFRRQPVQLRFADAAISLLRFAARFPPEESLVRDASDALSDHLSEKDLPDPFLEWARVRGVLSSNWDTAVRVPFGLVVFKKKIVVY
jgi:predicted nucleotidyltransferase